MMINIRVQGYRGAGLLRLIKNIQVRFQWKIKRHGTLML